ncbi:MAG: prolipoprotein diacylglyceryl transferase [Armatimonadetes bacterium]|nr:prolipoprotein diacylglyceryl transferase [Armatimonadota bacterium]
MRSILFEIGPVPIRSYGLMIIVGFLLGLWRATRAARRAGIAPERVMDACVIALLSGIAGARALFLLLEVPEAGWGVFAQVHRIWEGGLSFHGGLVAAVGAVAIYTRAKRIPFLSIADLLAPSLAIGYAFARIGCFLNGCCYGQPTDLPWAVSFFDPVIHAWTDPSHPAQLYAFAASLAIFGILTRVERLSRPTGFVFFSYVVLYSVYRFGVEFIRKGVTADVWLAGLTEAQVASLAAIVVFGVILLALNRRPAGAETRETRKRTQISS